MNRLEQKLGLVIRCSQRARQPVALIDSTSYGGTGTPNVHSPTVVSKVQNDKNLKQCTDFCAVQT